MNINKIIISSKQYLLKSKQQTNTKYVVMTIKFIKNMKEENINEDRY